MKIDISGGAPIWLSPRRENGVTIIQGTSRIKATNAEAQALIQAIQEMTAENQ